MKDDIIDLLASPNRRRCLFGLLYLSEGAPIGFIWLGLPTRLNAIGMPLDRITWLLALLLIPWTFKFAWAPLVDYWRGDRWGYRHWIIVTQLMMVASLVPLLSLDLKDQFSLIACFLLIHAISAATQDVSIDALCIASSAPAERATLNGWMQCGMLSGRALMGGGSLVLEHWIGFPAVVMVLMGVIGFSSILVWLSVEPNADWTAKHSSESRIGSPDRSIGDSTGGSLSFAQQLKASFRSPIIWIGVAFALLGPAAFKSLEAVVGPWLLTHGYDELEIGGFTATFMIGFMIAGSLLAGWLAQFMPPIRFVATTLVINLAAIGSMMWVDVANEQQKGSLLLAMLAVVALTIGMLTVAMYAWLMNCADSRLAATQFTLFMACTNACEAWSTMLLGQLQVRIGYPAAIAILCAISSLGLFVLWIASRVQPSGVRPKPVA